MPTHVPPPLSSSSSFFHLLLLPPSPLSLVPPPPPVLRRHRLPSFLRTSKPLAMVQLYGWEPAFSSGGAAVRISGTEAGNNNVDYYALIGLRRGCSRSKLQRQHLLLCLKHKHDKAMSFIDQCKLTDERDVEDIRERAKMSALSMYRLIQKGYASVMATIIVEEEEEVAEKQRKRALLHDAADAKSEVMNNDNNKGDGGGGGDD